MFSLDLGGSTVDMIEFEREQTQIIQTFSQNSGDLKNKDIKSILDFFGVTDKVITEGELTITGGKSETLPDEIIISTKTIHLCKIHEFEAIAHGACFLSGETRGLAISMGTGTAMVSFTNNIWEHVKGTGIGGGTFLALGRALLQTDDFNELENLVEQGDITNIDLSILDIVGSGIGNLPSSATASNFAKYSSQSHKSDIALGLANMISQSIATLAAEKAARLGHTKVIVGGKFSRLSILKTNITNTCKFLGIECIFPENSGFMTCIGACIR